MAGHRRRPVQAVLVEGTLRLRGQVDVGANTTVAGIGPDARLTGGGLHIRGRENVDDVFTDCPVTVTSRHSPENGAATLRNNALARTGDRWRAISAFPMEQRVKEA
ncbi:MULTISPECIES: hypothetical protein [unclassified Streptomyces]|uniref:hypothetical protein n=1 Tax=unclassified Streptomyces TaxID=2593676 RepID=UPI000DD92814|nr:MULTISPECIES: hypothetical protein [unclassified Streptomyces]QZZ32282.1 hypothetical protein A7X85_44240 [Streptomyces sp. ST1015]